MKKGLLIGLSIGGGIATTGIGAGIVAAVVIPSTLALKDGVENFVLPGGGASNSLANKETINYVALGDSIAAGYNGFLGADHMSYADFTAKSFINHGREVNYSNFAQSGDLIADLKKKTIQDPAVVEKLKEADLVTISIGGNDLLRYLEFFGTPFSELTSALSFGINPESLLTPDKNYDWSNTDEGSRSNIFGYDTMLSKSVDYIDNQTQTAIDTISDILTGEKQTADMFGMNETFREKLMLLVKQEYMEMMHTIHLVAKDAKIVVVSPPNPFLPFGDDVITQVNETLNMSITDYYNEIVATMKEATLYGYDGNRINFTDFVKSDDNKEFMDNVKNDWTTWEQYRAEDYNLDNAMPNIADIHPSTYGHEIIGADVFRQLAKQNNLTVDESKIQKSVKFTDDDITQPFERIDEGVMLFNDTMEALMYAMGQGYTESEIMEVVQKILLPSLGAQYMKSLGSIHYAKEYFDTLLKDETFKAKVVKAIKLQKEDDDYTPSMEEIYIESTRNYRFEGDSTHEDSYNEFLGNFAGLIDLFEEYKETEFDTSKEAYAEATNQLTGFLSYAKDINFYTKLQELKEKN